MAKVSTGLLSGGIPYLAVGDGAPLVSVQGLTPTHEVPRGMERRMALAGAASFTDHFRVYVVNRKQGLSPGASMADLAGHVAAAVEQECGEAVFLTGTSTGGSVALQLAVDRPDLVRALVVVSSAYRLSPHGRQVQQDLARLTRAGDGAGGWAQLMTALMPAPLRGPARPVTRVAMRSMAPKDPTDLLVTLAAEDAFDVGARLGRVSAPTLVIGGATDVLYTRELFEQTADGVCDGRAHIFAGWGHVRTASSSTTAHLTLGFLLAALRS
jgi:pimeloyl-ACP methyl ester carboxylesterase